MSYRLLPDNPLRNDEDLCNNRNCPKPTIFWNPQVVHSVTGRCAPLSEPFNPHIKAPVLHKCMSANPPPNYIRKYDGEYNHSSPKAFPSWVANHYYQMHTFGRCDIPNCRVYHHTSLLLKKVI